MRKLTFMHESHRISSTRRVWRSITGVSEAVGAMSGGEKLGSARKINLINFFVCTKNVKFAKFKGCLHSKLKKRGEDMTMTLYPHIGIAP